jgi:hypothetical protein
MENADLRCREALGRVGDSEEKALDVAGDRSGYVIVIEYQILLCCSWELH